MIKSDVIYKAFTEKVNELLADGAVFSIHTMFGHQGEVGKVDLIKGKDIYRVVILDGHETKSGCESWNWYNTKELYVLRYAGKANYSFDSFDGMLWMNKGEEVYKKVWYEITKTAYAETVEEIDAIEKKRTERRKLRGSRWGVEEKVYSNPRLLSFQIRMKEERGFKRARLLSVHRKTYDDGSKSFTAIFDNGKTVSLGYRLGRIGR